jgi:uncharacterized protein
MTPVLILIPPSEGKSPQGHSKPLGDLNPNVRPVYDRLISHKESLSRLYGVKDKALEEAKAANASILTAPTMPAIERYTGVVYDGIDYVTMSEKGKEFFNTHVRIVSALFGLLKPGDLIPDYKLKIEKLDTAKHWQPIIYKELKGTFVIDLLPQAHEKAVAYSQGFKVDFIVRRGGKAVAAGHEGKLIKGKFVRWLCENQVTDPKEFGGFKADGFAFNGCNFTKG